MQPTAQAPNRPTIKSFFSDVMASGVVVIGLPRVAYRL